MKKLYGVTTAMTTPISQNGNLDIQGTIDLTNFLIEKGVDCLFPLGTTGEMLKLSIEERKKIAEIVVETAAERVNVFIHTGALTTEATIELSEHALQIGADGIGVISPIFFPANEEEVIQYYAEVAEKMPIDFPIYLYNIPQNSSNDLSLSTAKYLAKRYQNIIGIKYSYPDFVRLKDYLTINDGEFSVLTGADTLFLPALSMGCDGVVSGVSGVYPEPFVEIYEDFKTSNIYEAQSVQSKANELITILKAGANLSYFKNALHFRGLARSYVRKPQINISEEEEKNLRTSLKKWNHEYQTKSLS